LVTPGLNLTSIGINLGVDELFRVEYVCFLKSAAYGR